VEISQIYKSHPDRLRDWLNHPKANGYQALHTTMMSKQGRWIEVQIRSDRMDEIAEQGFAAHWKYKDGMEKEFTEDETELNDWLRTIKEILDDPQPDAMDFLDAIKLNLFATEIFVFTPKGEIKTMPSGCTALDFAFSIHTFLGSHCIGAKVNHKLVPLSHKLQSGDQVEIITSKSQHVQESWVNFVSTAKAKAKILAILRRNSRETRRLGEEILSEFLHKNALQDVPNAAERLAEFHEVQNRDEFLQALGAKTILLGEKDLDELQGKNVGSKHGWRKLVPFLGRPTTPKKDEGQQQELFVVPEKFNRKKPIFINDDNIRQYKFKPCCHPIPGDDILGFIDGKHQIEIHKRACPVAAKLKASFGNRILDAKWDMHKRLFFDATIRLQGIDRVGMLLNIATVISSQMNVNMRKLTIGTNEGVFDGTIEMRVHDREDVKHIIDQLKVIDGLQDVTQIV
jgi:GTP pyrophosphokinase